MLSQLASSADALCETSPDQSSCSSDTGDVLIRSTRVRFSDRRHEARPGPGPGSVQITVQKLRDAPVQPPLAEQQLRSSGTAKQQRPEPRQPDNAPPLRAAGRGQPDRLKKPGPTKENREPRSRRSPAAESSPDRKFSGTRSDQQPDQLSEGPERLQKHPEYQVNPEADPASADITTVLTSSPSGQDVVTSRFAAGGRGVVLAALKQRSHSAPHRREVKVQLLDPGPLQTSSRDAPGLWISSQDAAGVAGVQTEEGLSSGCLGNATNAAAAAAAALIQAQSGLEARVSQLTEGVEKLLQADREGRARGRGLSQQTLHSQQLQLQSQLLESALRIVTGHAPLTSDPTASGQTSCLQVAHLDAAATRAAATLETSPVAMATAHRDRWPEQTRDDWCCRGAPIVSTATQPAAGSHLRSSANYSQVVATRANETLREMERLKTEMKMLLTQPEDSLKTTRSGPEHHQFQQSPSPPNHLQSQSQRSQSQRSQSQRSQSQQSQSQRSQSQRSQSQQSQSQQSQSQQSKSQRSQSQQTEFQRTYSQTHRTPFQQTQSKQCQTQSQPSQQSQSVLIQGRPVVPSLLEEAGLVLRQVRRQKKVLEENLEALLRAKTGEVLHCQLEALAANRDGTEEVRIKKTVDAWISTLTKDIQAEMSSEVVAMTSQQRAAGSSAHTDKERPVSTLRGTGSNTVAERGSRGQLRGAEPDRDTGESYLTRLYGRAPYEGLRRTLKKGPYLRFSSPAFPLSRKPRPQLVESVTGVKVKSCKTQTCLAPPLTPQHHDIISPSHLTTGDPADLTVTPAASCSVPMAIPLGRPRMNASSRCLTECQQEVISPPTAPPTASVVAVGDGGSEIQSQEEEEEPLDAAPPPLDIIERKSEEEEDIFPRTHFLSVADVIQEEEVSAVGEDVVELDGAPSPPPVLYQDPVFPPQARSGLPVQDQASVLAQRDTLENRLVEWVEQQLMSRMISEMYRPPPPDPAQNDSTDQSESEEQSVTSDIVEAAGGGGLQLFVDSNVSVDSALIRQLVNEVLTEHVSLMLGQRDSLETGPELGLELPGPGAHQEDKLVPLVPTPEPTPPPSPDPPTRETPPVTTPPPSEPTSPLNDESPQPITAPEPVATPTSSPEPAHSAGSPPAVHPGPPPLTWGDAELPLDEERPDMDTPPQPLVMSVAEEEPPLSSPLPPPSIPPTPSLSPSPPSGPDPRPASPSSSSEDSSSTTVTAGTDPTLRHISEGELLITVNQLAAMTEEEAVCSFSSSLQELQDMDFDPPSEGQVRGHDLLLTLLTKMEQGVTTREERPQPEGSWGRDQEEEEVSMGEVRDDRTANSKSIAAWKGQTSSPGQISQCADVSEVRFEVTNQGSVTIEPIDTLTSDLQINLSLSPHPHLDNTHTTGQVLPVQQYDRHTAEEQGGARRMEVHLPSITPEEEQQEVSAAADTDSSTDDIF